MSYTYEQFVADLHAAVNRTSNPRATYNFLLALCGAPPTHPQTGREEARA